MAKIFLLTLKLKILRIFIRKIDALKYIGKFLQKYYLATRHEPDKYTPDGSRFLHLEPVPKNNSRVTGTRVRSGSHSRYLMDWIRFRSYIRKMSFVSLSRSRGLGKVT